MNESVIKQLLHAAFAAGLPPEATAMVIREFGGLEDVIVAVAKRLLAEDELKGSGVKYPHIVATLTNDAFEILVTVRNALRDGGVPVDEVKVYTTAALSGDYDNLLRTTLAWVRVA